MFGVIKHHVDGFVFQYHFLQRDYIFVLYLAIELSDVSDEITVKKSYTPRSL